MDTDDVLARCHRIRIRVISYQDGFVVPLTLFSIRNNGCERLIHPVPLHYLILQRDIAGGSYCPPGHPAADHNSDYSRQREVYSDSSHCLSHAGPNCMVCYVVSSKLRQRED
jgi:hypothetical protein